MKYCNMVILAISVFLLPFGCKTDGETKKQKEVHESGSADRYQQGSVLSFHEAALTGQAGDVLKYLEAGIDVNVRDSDGRTALMYASYNGHVEVMRNLLLKGADVNLQDNYGRTALMMASSGPFPQAVRLLLDNYADPNIADKEEHFTALMYAAAEGQTEIVKILLSRNANPSLKDKDGDMALTFALNNGHDEVVKILKPVTK